MSTPGWSDLQVTNDVASLLLKGLGYQQHLDTLSVAITYRALANGQLDVFLGDWTPAHDSFTAPLLAAHKIERLGRNLTGAKYTLVVPDYVAAAGVSSVSDLAAHGDRFGYQIFGIDEGSPGNERIEAAVTRWASPVGTWCPRPNRACWPRPRATSRAGDGSCSWGGNRTR